MKKYLFLISIIFIVNNLSAQLKTSKLFSNNMVIQQNHNINVWGTYTSGKKIKIKFNKKTLKTKADKNGDWKVTFPAIKGSYNSYTLTISSGKETITYNNILVGDVWICSGQSNMEWPLIKTDNAQEEIAIANDTYIRHFKVPTSSAESPEKTLAGGTWEVTSPNTVSNFTAVGYYFAKNIRKHHNVPIGLLNSTWGGSRIEPWMNAKTLNIENPKAFLEEVQKEQNEAFLKMASELKTKFPYLTEEDAGTVNGEAIWVKPNLNESDWVSINVPQLWESQGYNGFDGIAWYRTTLNLTKEQANNSATLSLGMVDDSDYVWINGQKIGETVEQYDTKRIYTIDSKYLTAGDNVITVKVHDTGGGGGIYGNPEDLFFQTSDKKISLAKTWKFKIGSYSKPFTGVNQVPTLLYNKMIYPLLNFPIKGAIWYQGESNANNETESKEYATLFPKMIKQWRNDWNLGDFPFLWVQLANFMQAQEPNTPSNWALLRASQSSTLKLPNTAEAVIIDIGDADDIHPRNKKDVGYRLSLGARKLAYNENILYSGPTYKSSEINGNKIEITFNYTESGLNNTDKYGYVKGFTIAGADKNFVWAKAEIKDNKVIVWSDAIKEPKYVRYAWADNPDDANLYNNEGLPATPFKTDE
ncbi:beta galactosidase jelly roll domain-containing protein [Flaviramulus sp. BrNp1-15]|uniref:sialate O-acetylesterase n=1 Tax=Flaviramulus sp. BrNp1-15 TaxID=2916754 RepID=UPI001EE8DF5F|nr:sialate O-acetylesterase [Flaviramulus sp. BrNp1-15]ULC58035.1 beta galactosidase jelly roll domain-containing protein [Flaviramulus sp. BrNp1-15]